jgi:hypothetical protein
MKKNLLIVISLLALVGSQVGCEVRPWVETAKQQAADGNIDCDEYSKLADILKKSTIDADRRLIGETKDVDHEKFASDIVRELKKDGVTLSRADVCDPESNRKFNLSFFLENSGSIDGYVSGATEFEAALYSLLGSMSTSDMIDRLELNYINNQIHGFQRRDGEGVNDWLRRFIVELEPQTFRDRGGDRSNTDLRQVAKTALAKAGNGNVSILVSDFILSFSSGTNVEEALTRERISITNDFKEHLNKNPDLGVMVLHLTSQFTGNFYDYRNTTVPLNRVQRPYYIWIMGSNRDLKRISDSGVLESMKGGGVKNQAIFTSTEKAPPIPYRILAQPKVGEFELPDGARGPIVGVKPGRDEKKNFVFSFAIAADFSKQLQNLSVFDDLATYKLNDENYSVKVERIKSDAKSLEGFTHRLIFTTSKFKHGELKVEFHSLFPEWIARFSNDSDADIVTNDEAKTQTFGLSDMLGSLQDAFYSNNKTAFNSLTIKIQK